MGKANQLKRGNVIRLNDQLYAIRGIVVQSPSARGAATLFKMRLDNVRTGQKLDQTFRGDDVLEDVQITRREVEYSYQDASGFVFIDLEDFNQYVLSDDELGDQVKWLTEGLSGIYAILYEDRVISIELPPAIEAPIAETTPGMRGASATARTKPATLATGLEVQVPEYLEPGQVIRVSTEDGRFLGRA